MKSILKYLLSITLAVILGVVGGFSLAFSVSLVPTDVRNAQIGYIQKEWTHYKGSSILDNDKILYILTQDRFSEEWFMIETYALSDEYENGYKLEYDFYTKQKLDYLSKVPFSYFDVPAVYAINRDSFLRKFLLLCGIIGILIFILWSYFKKTNKSIEDELNRLIWSLHHIKGLLKRNQPNMTKFESNIINNIEIKKIVKGILGVRTWYEKAGVLYSTAIDYKWNKRYLYSNKQVSDNPCTGIYAYRLGSVDTSMIPFKQFFGIVELSGEWYEHEGGIIRAQRCEIICILTSQQAQAELLSSNYGIPVVVCQNPKNEYQKWLFSQNGLKWLNYNSELLKEGTPWLQKKESSEEVKYLAKSPCQFHTKKLKKSQ